MSYNRNLFTELEFLREINSVEDKNLLFFKISVVTKFKLCLDIGFI